MTEIDKELEAKLIANEFNNRQWHGRVVPVLGGYAGRVFNEVDGNNCDHRHEYRWQAHICAMREALARNEREAA